MNQFDPALLIPIGVIVFLLLLSAFFSCSETEFGSLSASMGHKNRFPALSFTHTRGFVSTMTVLLSFTFLNVCARISLKKQAGYVFIG